MSPPFPDSTAPASGRPFVATVILVTAAHAGAVGWLAHPAPPPGPLALPPPLSVRVIAPEPVRAPPPPTPGASSQPAPKKPPAVTLPSPLAVATALPETTAPTTPPAPATEPAVLPAPTFAPPAAPAAAAGAMTPARVAAAYLDNPHPVYPLASRRLGEAGRVVLRVHVDAEGRATEVVVRDSSGHPRLDAAAREAVSRWRFIPAQRGEERIADWVLVPIVFTLEG